MFPWAYMGTTAGLQMGPKGHLFQHELPVGRDPDAIPTVHHQIRNSAAILI